MDDTDVRFGRGDLAAFAVWAAAGIVAAAMVEGGYLLSWVGAVGGTAAVVRLPGAWRTWRTARRLRGRGVSCIRVERLMEKARQADALWLGRGFPWTARHAEAAHGILWETPPELPEAGADGPGLPWIHGLGAAERDLALPLNESSAHLLVLGTTGSGKTRFFELLVTQAVARGEAAVIIDPKGDSGLREAAERACRATGAAERFAMLHPAFPARSVRLNPLHNFTRGTELASRIAQLIPGSDGGDPFRAFAHTVLTGMVNGMVLAGERPDLLRIRQTLADGPERLLARAIVNHCRRAGAAPTPEVLSRRTGALVRFYRERVRPSDPNPDIDALIATFEHDRVHLAKMTASLRPVLEMLTAGRLGPMLSPDPGDAADPRPLTDTRRLVDQRRVLYVGLDSLTDGVVGNALGAMILSDLAAVAGDRYNFGTGTGPVNVFVDEAAEVMNDALVQLLNKGRGSGMRLVVASQSIQDFVARSGSEAKMRQVLANVNHVVCFRVLEATTRDYVTEMLPEVRVRRLMRTQASASDGVSFHSGHVGERLMEEPRELFPAPLLGMLPNLEFVAVLSGGRVYKGTVPLLEGG